MRPLRLHLEEYDVGRVSLAASATNCGQSARRNDAPPRPEPRSVCLAVRQLDANRQQLEDRLQHHLDDAVEVKTDIAVLKNQMADMRSLVKVGWRHC